jgi:nitroreductase
MQSCRGIGWARSNRVTQIIGYGIRNHHPMSQSLDENLSVILGRRSIRDYEPTPVSNELVTALLRAAMAAPSACCKDPWRFVVIRNGATLERIAEALPNGKFLSKAQVGIVVLGDLSAAHAGELSYLLQDCSAAIENLLIAAHVLGLGACWLGVHPRQPRVDALVEILGLPQGIVPVSCIAIGYPSERKARRTRFTQEFVHEESW